LSAHRQVLLNGDLNLDALRVDDLNYARRSMLVEWWTASAAAGLTYLETEYTYRSHGKYLRDGKRDQRKAALDHVYVAGITATVEVLKDSTTDHRPVLARVWPNAAVSKAASISSLERRNFKSLRADTLNEALSLLNWEEIYKIKNATAALEFLTAGIASALEIVAPFKSLNVRIFICRLTHLRR
jgi:hypothetical protein